MFFNINLFLFLLLKLNFNKCQEFSLLGDAYESFSPCFHHTDIISMGRIIGGSPLTENYWDGSMNFQSVYPDLQDARLRLKLKSVANITIEPNIGTVKSEGDYFIIEFNNEKGFNRYGINFRVQGQFNKSFPNIEFLELNDVDICTNPEQWKPAILGLYDSISASNGGYENTDDSVRTPQNCGKKKILHQAFITNGFQTRPGDWPWHAAIFYLSDSNEFSYRCGGTLISPRFILSATHCFYKSNPNDIDLKKFLIKLGLHNRLLAEKYTQELHIIEIIMHENFNNIKLKNDLTALKLEKDVEFTAYVQPICLWSPSDQEKVSDNNGIVVGWGYNELDKISETLLQAKMPLIPFLECLNSNPDFFGNFLTNNVYCAGFKNGTSVCVGDSGGGMYLKVGNVYKLRGITSLSVVKHETGLCDPNEYAIFTDMSQYIPWIERTIGIPNKNLINLLSNLTIID